MLGQLLKEDLGLALVASYLPIDTFASPMCFEVAPQHILPAGQAAHAIVKASLLSILPLDRQFTLLSRTLDHGVATVYRHVVLHFPALDLRFATMVGLGTFHKQIVQDVTEDLASG